MKVDTDETSTEGTAETRGGGHYSMASWFSCSAPASSLASLPSLLLLLFLCLCLRWLSPSSLSCRLLLLLLMVRAKVKGQRIPGRSGPTAATSPSHGGDASSSCCCPAPPRLRRLRPLPLPARGLVPPLLFVSVPPLSVSFLLLTAGPVTMAFPVSSLLVLAVTVPFVIAA